MYMGPCVCMWTPDINIRDQGFYISFGTISPFFSNVGLGSFTESEVLQLTSQSGYQELRILLLSHTSTEIMGECHQV